MFGVAVLAYTVAVTQRSSLGVAGLDAVDRFGASATALSMLAVAQVAVYAVMQLPAGMVLDRFGPTRPALAGTLAMAVGQVIVAFAPTLAIAVFGRTFVGIGDALIFVSGLRIIGEWFTPRQAPVLQQWFANLGQIGQFLSAVPFAMLLHLAGWQSAFLATAALSVLVAVAIGLVLHDTPARRFAGSVVSLPEALSKLSAAFLRPGTRVGFWSHFVTQFPGTVVSLLWGFPILVQGLGVEPQLAAVLIVVPVAFGMLCGPILGVLSARYPFRRTNIVIGIAVILAFCWIAVIVWPGQPPLWWMIVTLCATGAGGTGSTIGFDFARTFNPSTSHGSASGIVNIGGFTASGICLLAIGMLADLAGRGPDGTLPWSSFQLALWSIPVLVALGLLGLLRARARTRDKLAAEEGVVVAPLWRSVIRRWRRRH